MEGNHQRFLSGGCEVRLALFFSLLARHLLQHVVRLGRSEGQDNDQREVVGSIDDDQQLLGEGLDLLLIVQQTHKRSQSVAGGPGHEEIRA